MEELRVKDDFNPTDFDIPLTDEVKVHMNEASISEMNLSQILRKNEHSSFIDELRRSGDKRMTIILNQHVDMETKDTYNISGQAGAVCPGAMANDFEQHQQVNPFPDDFDYDELSKQLEKLLQHLQTIKNEPEANQLDSINNVIKADEAAKMKDGNKVMQFLKKVGSWVLDGAKEIGVKLAEEAILKSMGS